MWKKLLTCRVRSEFFPQIILHGIWESQKVNLFQAFVLKNKVSWDFKTLLTFVISQKCCSQISLYSGTHGSACFCFWSNDAIKITFFFPENCHYLNLFLTSAYFLCSVQETFPAKLSTECSQYAPIAAELDVTAQGSSVPVHFNSCHAMK